MSAKKFQHLHVHSHYSLLDGVITIPNLVAAARDLGMGALALTDHGNMFGAPQFSKAAKAAGIKPIIGMEAYITDGSRFERKREVGKSQFFHLILLVENEIGYRNLIKLSSTAFVDGFYYKPRIDHEVLREHSEGLIGLSACLSSEVNRALLHGEDEKALDCTRRYVDTFSPGRFFMEIQDHGLPEQRRILEKVPDLARRLGLPLVATNDIHYLHREDARAQEVHLCINTGTSIDDKNRISFDSDQFYFRSGDEMARTFAEWPEAVTNTDEIAAMVTFDLESEQRHLPIFRSGEIHSDESADPNVLEKENRILFSELIEKGFKERYIDPPTSVRERLEYEIRVIEEMGFVSYFLIVWDFIRYAKEQGIPVGPGRGSAVGSIASYCLGITKLCPIEYDLIFERFLNSDRISMPDIDIDFCMDGREKVIDYVREKYGEDRVCQVITFGTMAARAVLRDVGRALAIPLKEIDQIAKKVPDTIGIKLDEALRKEPQLAQWSKDARYKTLFEVGSKLEGLNRHCSTHAAGVVISDQPLTNLVPLYRNGDDITTQFPMEVLEEMGLLKVDFLGLRTLTIISRALVIIEDESGKQIDIDNLPLDDSPTYDLLQRADTIGVFQLESAGMRELLHNLVPDCFEDLIAVLALYRPGPLGSGMHNTFCKRKHGKESIEYLHSSLEPILNRSNGVILYQEQVMRIAHDLAGFTMNEADSLRKAMGKKKPEILKRFKQQFRDGAVEREIPVIVAESIFEQIEHFAKYGFNRSHSTAYALISYQTAWLKANHPEPFLAAVLSCHVTSVEKMVDYLEECKRLGIVVRPPHVNQSGKNFSVKDKVIQYGLVAIKGVGEKAVDGIIEERDSKGPFLSIFNLTSRVDPKQVNKTTLEQLVSAGAFDELGPSRSRMHVAVKDAIDEGNRIHAERRAGQLSLFQSSSDASDFREVFPEVPEWSESEKLTMEKGSLGFYLSGHPLERREDELTPFRSHLLAELDESADGKPVSIGVLVGKVRNRQTRKGDAMAILHVEDRSGSLEVVVFPKTFQKTSRFLEEDRILIVEGIAEITEERSQVRADRIVPLEDAWEILGSRIGIILDPCETSEDLLFRIKDLFSRNPGTMPVSLLFKGEDGHNWVMRCGSKSSVRPTAEMLEEIRALVGDERVRVERTSS